MDSILTSIKKLLGPTEEQEHFDTDIIIHINTVFRILNQLGVGKDGFFISDKTAVWSDFIEDESKFNDVKTYVYLRVRMLFDPPQNGTVIASIEKMINELEWRLNVAAETPE